MKRSVLPVKCRSVSKVAHRGRSLSAILIDRYRKQIHEPSIEKNASQCDDHLGQSNPLPINRHPHSESEPNLPGEHYHYLGESEE